MIEIKSTVNTGCGAKHHSFFDGFKKGRTWAIGLFIVGLLASSLLTAHGLEEMGAELVHGAAQKTGQYLMQQAEEIRPGSVGGEWTILGLARSGVSGTAPVFDTYVDRAIGELDEAEGILSHRKYSEYSRWILAMTAIGKDPKNLGGHDLLKFLENFEAVKRQGINGPAFALLALDSGVYEVTKMHREQLLRHLIQREISGGGFSMDGITPDPDVTAFVLQALAPYESRGDVGPVIQRGLGYLASLKDEKGGCRGIDDKAVESVSQILIALTSLNRDPLVMWPGLVDALLSYQKEDGSFSHTLGGASDRMATEQAYLALVALKRQEEGVSSLYQMEDVAEYKVTLDGSFLSFDQGSINRNNRVLVPMRGVFEALGAIVHWEEERQTVTGHLGDTMIQLTIGEMVAYKNKERIWLDEPGQIVGDRALVPIRFVAESLGASVGWNAATRTVEIQTQ